MLRVLTRFACLGVLLILCSCSGGAKLANDRGSAVSGQLASGAATPTWQYSDPAFAPLPGARVLYGRLANALYEIEVPGAWNGEVVMYAHGFNGSEPFLIVTPPPLRQHLIDQGFAWAASSFRDNGYDPQAGVDDTFALLDYFKQHVGAPQRSYIYGSSMGGHVVVSSLEEHPDVYSGAFSECGVVAGVKEMDYLVSYEAVGQYLAGLQLLPVQNIEAYQAAVTNQLVPAIQNQTSKRLTTTGRAFESIIKNLSGGARPFRREGFLDRLAGNFTVTFDDLGKKTLAARAASNADLSYRVDSGFGLSDEAINQGVYRLRADPSVRNARNYPALAPLTGKIEVPLLTIHTTGDGFVPLSMEQDYRRSVDAAGSGDLLVQRAIRRPDHCQFTAAEREQAWDDLVQWVRQGTRPAGDDLLAADLSQVGLQWTKPLLPGDPGGL